VIQVRTRQQSLQVHKYWWVQDNQAFSKVFLQFSVFNFCSSKREREKKTKEKRETILFVVWYGSWKPQSTGFFKD
jgi:hypothetical protein